MQEIRLTLKEFMQKLEAIGYQPFQVELILKETLGVVSMDKLSAVETLISGEELKRYIHFASSYRDMRTRRTGTMEWSW